MFIAIVQIPMTTWPRDAAVEAARRSAPTYAALGANGLLKKHYLNGEAGGGGVYLWESEAAFGVKPSVTDHDNHVVVDDEAGKVRVENQYT